MTKITLIAADGAKTTIDADDGNSLMQASVANGVEGIVGECCGAMMCATCHVYVDEAYLGLLPARSEGEDEMLDCAASARRPSSRLSCQIRIGPEIDGLVVHLPEEQ